MGPQVLSWGRERSQRQNAGAAAAEAYSKEQSGGGACANCPPPRRGPGLGGDGLRVQADPGRNKRAGVRVG